MPEEITEKVKVSSTNPLPFEVMITQQLTAILSRLEQSDANLVAFRTEVNERFDRLEARQTQLEARQTQLEAQQAQTNAELRNLTQGVYKIDERFSNLEYKMDTFLTEQVVIKRELYKVQEVVGLKRGLDRLPAELGVNG